MKKRYLVAGLLLVFIVLSFTYKHLTKLDELGHTLFYGNEFLQSFYLLGNTKTAIGIAVGILIWQLVIRNWRGVLLVLLSVAGTNMINQVLKNMIERPRPEMTGQLDSFSFPSGHSMISVGYLMVLAYLIAQHLSQRSMQRVLFCLALLLIVCIGLSRIAQGHHYLTDILAGWSLASAWVIFCITWYARSQKSNYK